MKIGEEIAMVTGDDKPMKRKRQRKAKDNNHADYYDTNNTNIDSKSFSLH
jgi:hypothetical protein